MQDARQLEPDVVVGEVCVGILLGHEIDVAGEVLLGLREVPAVGRHLACVEQDDGLVGRGLHGALDVSHGFIEPARAGKHAGVNEPHGRGVGMSGQKVLEDVLRSGPVGLPAEVGRRSEHGLAVGREPDGGSACAAGAGNVAAGLAEEADGQLDPGVLRLLLPIGGEDCFKSGGGGFGLGEERRDVRDQLGLVLRVCVHAGKQLDVFGLTALFDGVEENRAPGKASFRIDRGPGARLFKHDVGIAGLKGGAPGEFAHFRGLRSRERLVEERQSNLGLLPVRGDLGGYDFIKRLGGIARF